MQLAGIARGGLEFGENSRRSRAGGAVCVLGCALAGGAQVKLDIAVDEVTSLRGLLILNVKLLIAPAQDAPEEVSHDTVLYRRARENQEGLSTTVGFAGR